MRHNKTKHQWIMKKVPTEFHTFRSLIKAIQREFSIRNSFQLHLFVVATKFIGSRKTVQIPCGR